ncbi:ATP phosphoribosyltransferase regulatory subunit [Limibaculum sp. FT325]|uniref:ATP phosphoribosyltransferase regulatory subunit n=1 Tax=Thermohalobaculum sediminis TaxID=2939436 RepID=UPI0020BED751|nr:ATP phosphoribosyltransferase regulatory subunit [Limibaculum sediminis]MCL5777130.1 ATP phosphoribosyltransferase regulatory subunit [Limibaculum sediminis]
MTPPTRLGPDLAALERALGGLARLFTGAGYEAVSPPHLFPADLMLDLYGEDIRARAFLFPGGGGDEVCLRPDFTVPVVLAHGERGWGRPARYAYQGPVFRRQAAGSSRPVEYLQAGVENLGAADPAAAEAEVLDLTLRGLGLLGVGAHRVTTGDLGIVFGLLDALEMPAGRRARLRRHLWRPARFHALVAGAVAGAPAPTPRRAALIAAVAAPDPLARIERLAAAEGEIIGLREIEDIAERAAALAEAAAEPPMPAAQADLIEAALAVTGPAEQALARLRDLTAAAGVDLGPQLDAFARRLDAMAARGLDGATLAFDADFGRNLEYYDGFVFEITGPDPALPLAGGGRYDSMTARLGAGRAIPAIGAMIRPEAALAAAGGA